MRYFRSSDEMFQGSDPNDASDNGLPPPPDSLVEISFHIYGIAGYTPGYKGPNAAISIDNAGKLSAPQRMNLVVEGLPPYSLCDSVEFDILETTAIPGFCMNSASGGTEDDYSLSATTDDRGPVAGTMSGNACTVPFYCKDFGGWCRVRAVCRKNGVEVLTLTNTVPADVNNNKISDKWEKNAIALHNETYANDPLTWEDDPYADPDGDNEPAALGNRRTDGSYSHADTGDGLSVFDEYRGYLLDGGADFTATRHKRLSPTLKELLVQVNELPGMAQQPSFNPAALSAYSFNSIMQQVAQFYCHPTRGLGIDLYWCRRDFTALGTQFVPDSNLPPISPHRYRFNGNLFEPDYHDPLTRLTNGISLVMQDYRLITPPYNSANNVAQYQAYQSRWANGFQEFIKESRDVLLPDFVKLILVDRRGDVYFDANNRVANEVKVMNNGNAVSYTTSATSEKQGSCVCVSAIADEKYITPNGALTDYTGSQFLNQLVWAIAHELGHLLTAGHIAAPSGHLSSSNVLMTDDNPAPAGITVITSDAEELGKIDLKNRFSVQH